MNRFIQLVSRAFSPVPALAPVISTGVAENLMQRADACASRNPLEAQELRGAAYAFLRVVR